MATCFWSLECSYVLVSHWFEHLHFLYKENADSISSFLTAEKLKQTFNHWPLQSGDPVALLDSDGHSDWFWCSCVPRWKGDWKAIQSCFECLLSPYGQQIDCILWLAQCLYIKGVNNAPINMGLKGSLICLMSVGIRRIICYLYYHYISNHHQNIKWGNIFCKNCVPLLQLSSRELEDQCHGSSKLFRWDFKMAHLNW